MKQYPLFLTVDGTAPIIIGGADSALRKARLLIAAGARPRIIWPIINPGLDREFANAATFIRRLPVAEDFADAAFAIVAIDDDADIFGAEGDAPRVVAEMAKAEGVLVNVVDRPELCDFTTPSIVDRGDLTIGISTSGARPVLGRDLRQTIEAMVPARTGDLLAFARQYRGAVKEKIPSTERRRFWEQFFNGPIAAQLLAGDSKAAHEKMLGHLNADKTETAPVGVVHIVGAGPGDPELLTMKAFRLIQSADVIVHDRLVSDEIMALTRRDADRFYVGKAKDDHAVPQRDIEDHLIAFAREGKIVVRLKGGDPFVFGRGGEELEAVRAAGIPVYVTPGITAATGCAATAGMALTHRDHAQAVTFVTGHAKGNLDPDLDWEALATLKNTLVVYMGVGKSGAISRQLIDHGRSPATPVAVIEKGTCKDEKIVKGTLGNLPEIICAGGIIGPALLVIGDVAALARGDTLDLTSELKRNAA